MRDGLYGRDTVPRRILDALLARRLDDAVDGALDGVVAPAGEQIASIDDHGALDGSGVDELACRALDLEPAAAVLEEQGDGPVVLLRERK